MFMNLGTILRRCLRRNLSYARQRPHRFEARIHNLPQPASRTDEHRYDVEFEQQQPEPNDETFRRGQHHQARVNPVTNTSVNELHNTQSSTDASNNAHNPVESRVQSIRPPPARHPAWRLGEKLEDVLSERKLQDVLSHSDHIYGSGDRSGLKHWSPFRRPGPSVISGLEPFKPRSREATKSSQPPTRNSVSAISEFRPQTQYPDFVEFWKKNYLDLYMQSRTEGTAEVRQKFDVHRQLAIAFVRDRNLDELHDAWATCSEQDRGHLASIMLGCLVDSAARSLLMLSLDITFPRDWRHRCECLCYIDMMYAPEIERIPSLSQLFAQQIERISRIWTWPTDPAFMPWHFLVLLLRHNTPEHCENIIDTIFESVHTVPPRLVLVMVDYFTKLGNSDRAIELLSRIPPDQREEHKVRILERCANLVSIDTIEMSDTVGNFRALPTMIGLKLSMDAKIHNRILERAIELRVPEVAWEVFQFMEAREIPVEAHGHLLLLKDSFERNNRDRLDAMMSAVHGRKDLFQYPYLVTYMMHIVRVVCTIDRKLSSETSVSHLLALYDRAYDRGPLVKLGIVDALPANAARDLQLEQPPPAVLGFTIWAYVLCQRDERLVSALWFWIIHMIKQGDESILACAEHDIMWNGFIHFYAQSRFYLRKAVDVVESMIERNLCMPTERTWSEVLCGFLKHGEEETAVKIWQLMLDRNVHPTHGGWAYLLDKYDQTQLAELVKYVLEERRMPQSMGKALGWRSKAEVAQEAEDVEERSTLTTTQPVTQDFEDREMFEHQVSDNLGDPEVASNNVYQ